MEVDLDTPRTIIQGLIDAADTNDTERPVRRRRVTRTPENRLSRSLPSTEIKLSQQYGDSSVILDDSTPKKRKFAGKRRDSLVDSVRRKRFHFQRAELSKSYTQTVSNSSFTEDNSLESGEPRRKSPRLSYQTQTSDLTAEISSITNKVSWFGQSKRKREKPGFKFTVEHDSHEEQQTHSLRSTKKQTIQNDSWSSAKKQTSPMVPRSSPRNHMASSVTRESPRKQVTPNNSRSSPRNQVTPNTGTNRSSPQKQMTPTLSRSSPKKQTTPNAVRSSSRRQPTQIATKQHIPVHASNTESVSKYEGRTPEVFKISPSKIRTSTPRPGKKSSLTIEEIFSAENTTPRHNNKENASLSKSSLSNIKSKGHMSADNINSIDSPFKNSKSFNRKESETVDVTKSPSKSLIQTINPSSDRTLGTPSKRLRLADFQRVKQSTKKKTPPQSEKNSQSKLTTPQSVRNARKLTTSQLENVVDRTPTDHTLRDSEGPVHDTPGRETAITPAFERTALGPRHSSPVSRTVHISLTGDENLPDMSVIESRDDLDRTEFRLKTPHLGPARSHAPTPVDSPLSIPAVGQPAIQPAKEVKANRLNTGTTKKPRKKVQSHTIPATIIKQTFNHFCKMKVDKDTLPELVKITDEYFDQVYKDLEVFAHHAGRKTIDEKDAELLLRRQKFITKSTSLTHLVENHLPLELRQEMIPMARSGNKIFPRH